MIKELKNSFTQTTLGSMIWIAILTSFFHFPETNTQQTIWSVIGIGFIFGIIFGVLYPFLWNYATFTARIKIMMSSLINTIGGLSAVYLFSPMMFDYIKPYALAIFILTLIGHILGFYFYSSFENKKIARELNQRL